MTPFFDLAKTTRTQLTRIRSGFHTALSNHHIAMDSQSRRVLNAALTAAESELNQRPIEASPLNSLSVYELYHIAKYALRLADTMGVNHLNEALETDLREMREECLSIIESRRMEGDEDETQPTVTVS